MFLFSPPPLFLLLPPLLLLFLPFFLGGAGSLLVALAGLQLRELCQPPKWVLGLRGTCATTAADLFHLVITQEDS